MGQPWFRFYHEVLDDPKVQSLPADDFKFWINCLCIAHRNDGKLPSLPDAAFAMRMSEESCATFIEIMLKRKLLDRRGGAVWPHKWEERQFKEGGAKKGSRYVYLIKDPSSRIVKVGFSKNPWARVVDIRSEEKNPKLKVVATFRSKSVSEVDLHLLLAEHHHEFEWFEIPSKLLTIIIDFAKEEITYEELLGLLRSKHSDLLRSNTTNSDTETEQNNPLTPAGGSGGFETFWDRYPLKVGKGAAEKSWKRQKLTPLLNEILGALLTQKASAKWHEESGRFIPHPATWLNQKRWEDSPNLDLSPQMPAIPRPVY